MTHHVQLMVNGVYGLIGRTVHSPVVEVPVDATDSVHLVLMVGRSVKETGRNLCHVIIRAVLLMVCSKNGLSGLTVQYAVEEGTGPGTGLVMGRTMVDYHAAVNGMKQNYATLIHVQ